MKVIKYKPVHKATKQEYPLISQEEKNDPNKWGGYFYQHKFDFIEVKVDEEKLAAPPKEAKPVQDTKA